MYRLRCMTLCLGRAVLVAPILVFLSGQALHAADSAADRFKALDKDGDALVCWDEFCAVNPNISRRGFDSIDSNKDGNISPDEWRAFSANHGMGVPSASSSTMPARPAMPPLVMPPTTPGSDTPAVPLSPEVPKAGQLSDVPGPGAPSGVPLVTPPAQSTMSVPKVAGPKISVPSVSAPKLPLVTPPATPATPSAPKVSGEGAKAGA